MTVKKIVKKAVEGFNYDDEIQVSIVKIKNVYNIEIEFIIENVTNSKIISINTVANNLLSTLRIKGIKAIVSVNFKTIING